MPGKKIQSLGIRRRTFPLGWALVVMLAAARSGAAPAASPDRWTFSSGERFLIVECDGVKVGEYVYRDDRILRPYFANLRTPNGVEVTRHHPPVAGQDAVDHDAMHPGVWLAFGDINGQDFWRNKARMEHVRFLRNPEAHGDRLTFGTENRLRNSVGAAMGTVEFGFNLSARTNGWLLMWDSVFRADAGELRFGDQEEMGLGVRVASGITEMHGAQILSSRGVSTAKATWGQVAAWSDTSGVVDGKSVGVTLMADPSNFRASWWHNRDYGLMVANPFGREAMRQGSRSTVLVKSVESLRLRFGVMFHEGDGEAKERAFEAFRSTLAGALP